MKKQPTTYLSLGRGMYRIISQGMAACDDKKTMAEALAVAAQLRLELPEVAWNGDRLEWVTTSTIE